MLFVKNDISQVQSGLFPRRGGEGNLSHLHAPTLLIDVSLSKHAVTFTKQELVGQTPITK